MRPVPRLLACAGGAVAVEFAMISLVLLTALLGVFEAGRAMWVVHTLQRATEDAARLAFTGATDAQIDAAVSEGLADLDEDSVGKSIAAETVDGVSYKTITASFDFKPLLPLIPIEATITRRSRVPL